MCLKSLWAHCLPIGSNAPIYILRSFYFIYFSSWLHTSNAWMNQDVLDLIERICASKNRLHIQALSNLLQFSWLFVSFKCRIPMECNVESHHIKINLHMTMNTHRLRYRSFDFVHQAANWSTRRRSIASTHSACFRKILLLWTRISASPILYYFFDSTSPNSVQNTVNVSGSAIYLSRTWRYTLTWPFPYYCL